MSTWKKSALAALCAVALGGLAGCDAPGEYGRDDDEELREYPEKPGPMTGDEATGAGDVYDQPAGVGVPGQQPMQPQPWEQQQGIEQQQQGIEQQQQGIEQQQQGIEQQQQGIEQEQQEIEQQQLEIERQQQLQQGVQPADPNLGATGGGTIEEGSPTDPGRTEGFGRDTSDVSGSDAFDPEDDDDTMRPGTTTPGTRTPGTTTPGTTTPGGTGGTGF